MPKPRQGESRQDFVNRCVPIVINDGTAQNPNQAVAICNSLFEDKKMELHDKLLELLAKRGQAPGDTFGYGITTADKYLRPIVAANNDGASLKLIGWPLGDVETLLKDAAARTVYCNEEMVIGDEVVTNSSDFKSVLKEGSKVAIPKKSLMVFRNIVTTPLKDRDRDILRTAGAMVDPAMPLLAFHNHMLPIGKMLEVIDHTVEVLRVASVLLDINDLTHDMAILIEAMAIRISHGFQMIASEEMFLEKGEEWTGLDITKFEIMEESLVPVPSNVEAVIEAHSRGKLKSPQMATWGKTLMDARPVQMSINYDLAPVVENIEVTPDGKVKVAMRRSPDTKQGGDVKDDGEVKDDHAALNRDKVFARIEGSWEWIEDMLNRSARQKMVDAKIISGDPFDSGVWLEATFAKNGIIGVRTGGSQTFYQVNWKMDGDSPAWDGAPKEIKIVAVVKRNAYHERALREASDTHSEERRAAANLFALDPSDECLEAVKAAAENITARRAAAIEYEDMGITREELEQFV